jgi:hypothetical protein
MPPFVQVPRGDQKPVSQSLSTRSGDAVHGDKKTIKVDIADIVSVSACADLTLPPGAGLCIDTVHGSVYLVSNTFTDLNVFVLLLPSSTLAIGCLIQNTK